MKVSTAILEKANRHFLYKIAMNAALFVLGSALVIFLLTAIQQKSELKKQREYCELTLSDTVALLDVNRAAVVELTQVYHEDNQDMVEALSRYVLSQIAGSLAASDDQARAEMFQAVAKRTGIEYLFLLTPEGTVAISTEAGHYGIDPIAKGLLSESNLETLIQGTQRVDGLVIPVVESNQYGKFYFYSVPCRYAAGQYTLVLGASASILDMQIETLRDTAELLDNVVVENEGFLFSVDPRDGRFLYYDDGKVDLSGLSAFESGLSEEALQDGYAGGEKLNGMNCYVVTRAYNEGMVLCAAASKAAIFASNRHVLFVSRMGFIMTMVLCLAYTIIIRNDFVRRAVEPDRLVFRRKNGRSLYFNRAIFRKVIPLTAVCVLAIFCITFYAQTLLEISETIDRSNATLTELSLKENTDAGNREKIQNYYKEHFLSRARFVAYLLEEDPSFLNEDSNYIHTYYDENGKKEYCTDDYGYWLTSIPHSEKLQKLCNQLSLDSIYVFNEDGYTLATNTDNWYFVISRDPDDQSYPFLQVLDGKVQEYVQDIMVDDNGNLGQYIGVQFHYYVTQNPDGSPRYITREEFEELKRRRDQGEEFVLDDCRAMLQIGLDSRLATTLLSTANEASYSDGIAGDSFFLLFDSREEHICFYAPSEVCLGMTAEELGISPNAFSRGRFCSYLRLEGVPYFAFFRYIDGNYIATLTPSANVYRDRLPISLMTALISFALLLVLSCSMIFTTDEEEALYASENKKNGGLSGTVFDIGPAFGKLFSTAKKAARWEGSGLPWSERSVEEKLRFLLSVAAGLFLLYIVYTVLLANTLFDHDSIVLYILDGSWDRGLNTFALSACGMVILATAAAIFVCQILFYLLTSVMGPRTETICRLVLSVLKYGSGIVAIFYCLYLVGVDSTGLIASASVLSLVIGLGAQSLITDIIAGLFIVFEGTFRVGDIITVQGFRGTVLDISLRTTKVLGVDGNIGIYNNNDIKGVMNMTKQASYAVVKPCIEYGQDIGYVEAVLRRELPKLRREEPRILDGPNYLGVSDLGESGVELLITAKCEEQEIKDLTRFLNRAVLKIFYQYDINVPFPNVTVSQLDMEGRKTLDDLEGEKVPPEA